MPTFKVRIIKEATVGSYTELIVSANSREEILENSEDVYDNIGDWYGEDEVEATIFIDEVEEVDDMDEYVEVEL